MGLKVLLVIQVLRERLAILGLKVLQAILVYRVQRVIQETKE